MAPRVTTSEVPWCVFNKNGTKMWSSMKMVNVEQPYQLCANSILLGMTNIGYSRQKIKNWYHYLLHQNVVHFSTPIRKILSLYMLVWRIHQHTNTVSDKYTTIKVWYIYLYTAILDSMIPSRTKRTFNSQTTAFYSKPLFKVADTVEHLKSMQMMLKIKENKINKK